MPSNPPRAAANDNGWWLSGNALCRINEVNQRRARLELGWATVCRRVNHHCM